MSARVASRAALAGVSLAFALAAGELALRALPPQTLGFELNETGFIRPREFERDAARNSLGVHDVEPAPKSAGSRRVLLVGDSYVAAVALPIEKGVARRLEAHLASRPELGPVDVVSLSAEGWGQGEELAALAHHGRKLAPDLVLLLFTARNDVYNNAEDVEAKSQELEALGRAMREGGAIAELIPRERAIGLWFPSSLLNQLVSHRLTSARIRRSAPVPVSFRLFAPAHEREWLGAWERTSQLLERMRARARAIGADFAIASGSTPEGVLEPAAGAARLAASHPAYRDTVFDVDLVDAQLARVCAERAIPFAALQPALREIALRTGSELHFRYDGHWNERGNEEAARLLADFAAARLAARTPGG